MKNKTIMTDLLKEYQNENGWETFKYKDLDDYKTSMGKDNVILIEDKESNTPLYGFIYNSFFMNIVKIADKVYVEGLELQYETDEAQEVDKFYKEIKDKIFFQATHKRKLLDEVKVSKKDTTELYLALYVKHNIKNIINATEDEADFWKDLGDNKLGYSDIDDNGKMIVIAHMDGLVSTEEANEDALNFTTFTIKELYENFDYDWEGK